MSKKVQIINSWLIYESQLHSSSSSPFPRFLRPAVVFTIVVMCRRILTLILATAATVVSAQGFNGDWDVAYTKAIAALAKLQTADKVGVVTGVGWYVSPVSKALQKF